MEFPTSVSENSAVYELIGLEGLPIYNRLEGLIDIVKNFIIEKNLIVYGGTAIDYALRLRGDKIYPDDALKIPDLDFYSPDLAHPYEMADRLYREGALEARAINALHIGTMRVDAGDINWVADISYVPQSVFAKLPTLTYNGMRVIHPDYQRIDLHSSLAHPYDNAPREVIFARWKKDISRFNLLDHYYPLIIPQLDSPEVKKPQTAAYKYEDKYPLTGWVGYAILAQYYHNHGRPVDNIADASFTQHDDGHIAFETLNGIEYVVECINNIPGEKYEPYFNIIPQKAVHNGVTYYDTNHHHPGISTITIGGKSYIITGVQYLLKYFLTSYYYTDDKTYLTRYRSIINMIAQSPDDPVFLPSVEVYGKVNISSSQMYNIQKNMSTFTTQSPEPKPSNYNVERAKGVPPATFDPETSKYFRIEGRKIS